MSDSPISNLEFLEYLEQFITEHKISLINDVLEYRTRHFTIVLEDFYQSQNASATLRTSECLGIQDVHIVENYNPFQINPDITLGSSKWLSLHQYNEETGSNPNNTERCISNLKDLGYLIVATSLSAPSISLYDLPITKKLAIIFGNERDGLSSTALQMSDLHMRLPQYGFTQSYNVSVSVAITLSYLIEQVKKTTIAWQLSHEEKHQLRYDWYRSIIDRIEIIEEDFFKNRYKRK